MNGFRQSSQNDESWNAKSADPRTINAGRQTFTRMRRLRATSEASHPRAEQKKRMCYEFGFSARRSQTGTIAEFGTAFMVLIVFVLLPAINLSFIPLRYMFAEGVMSNLNRRLAHCEKYSDAEKLLVSDKWHRDFLNTCGVEVKNERLRLIATSNNGGGMTVKQGSLPDEYLPGGTFSPCIYSLELQAECTISALYQGPFKPATIKLSTHEQWENLAKNPKTAKYFINE